ncbi:MAG: hypothetical protein GY811_31000, partial [Myxococcales bacterium]|nr:hypothetical protein [Myxococcales bacterium]
MRHKRMIDVRPDPTRHQIWYRSRGDERAFASDVPAHVFEIPLVSVDGYEVGDWVVLRADATDEFKDEFGMVEVWDNPNMGLAFYRQIVAIDADTLTMTIDVPTRYPMKVRDNARIHRTVEHLEEIGIEELSIGNVQNTTPGMDTDDYTIPGRGGYEVHASFAIYLTAVVNSWVRNVSTFKPEGNNRAHLLSNGIRLERLASLWGPLALPTHACAPSPPLGKFHCVEFVQRWSSPGASRREAAGMFD